MDFESIKVLVFAVSCALLVRLIATQRVMDNTDKTNQLLSEILDRLNREHDSASDRHNDIMKKLDSLKK